MALSVLVALVSYRYLAKSGPVPANVLGNRFFDPWVIVHAGAAATALLFGVVQFSAEVRKRWPRLHRLGGRIYVVGCVLGGVSALVLSAGVSTGPWAVLGFGLPGAIWIYVTLQGWLAACARDFASHRIWMIRSYALTFAAVTLRVYIPVSQMVGVDFNAAYPVIAWLAWVPNLIAAEFHIRRRMRATATNHS
jgi:uncharacterized membrane protein